MSDLESAIRKLAPKKWTDRQIAEKTGYSAQHVHRVRTSLGIPSGSHKGGTRDRAKFRRLYDAGLTDAEIALSMDRHRSAVTQMRLEQGLPPNPRFIPKGFGPAEQRRRKEATWRKFSEKRRNERALKASRAAKIKAVTRLPDAKPTVDAKPVQDDAKAKAVALHNAINDPKRPVSERQTYTAIAMRLVHKDPAFSRAWQEVIQ